MSANFEPDRHVITAITLANPGVVTAASHGYATDAIVRINIPVTYGMRLSGVQATISVVNANTFSIDVDTTLLDAFVVPIVEPFTRAEVLPISAEIDNIAT